MVFSHFFLEATSGRVTLDAPTAIISWTPGAHAMADVVASSVEEAVAGAVVVSLDAGGWDEVEDELGHVYYHHVSSGHVQWEATFELFDESADRFVGSGLRPILLCVHFMGGQLDQRWQCTFAHREQKFHPASSFAGDVGMKLEDHVASPVGCVSEIGVEHGGAVHPRLHVDGLDRGFASGPGLPW